jgi:hypothetical protein
MSVRLYQLQGAHTDGVYGILLCGVFVKVRAAFQLLFRPDNNNDTAHAALTERRGRVVKTPASYSGGPWLKSRPGWPAILSEGFLGFSQSLQANAGLIP